MVKLYPPNIEGTIPAFYGTTLVVPFSMNRAVGASEVKSIMLKVKKVNSTEIILTKETTRFDAYSNCKAYFYLSKEEQALFNIGQFYRVQLAYVDNTNIVGYYSTIGVVKYTACPTVSILNLSTESSNMHLYDYTLHYQQNETSKGGDPTEKLYSCRFYLYDINDKIVLDSGDIFHSVLNDVVPNESTENYYIPRDLEYNKVFKLRATVTTTNGVVITTPRYRLVQQQTPDESYAIISKMVLNAYNDYDKGVVRLNLTSIAMDDICSGIFLLSRSEAKEPYEWQKMKRFAIKGRPVGEQMLIDYTVEQGKKYIYSIQQYNNYGIYSNRTVSNTVFVDFEDLFLLDADKQLKIKFNPKVSSMKNNILETKTNTIGSKYPFITRNGRVNHKEFNLSGLISYQMDDERDFMSWDELGIEQNITNLTGDNIAAERKFKLEVLDWLSDGKPKIMKSPVEGNYIVKLMNASLAPNDTLGRMLHTFSCNATEVAAFDYLHLYEMGFMDLSEPNTMVSQWMTVEFSKVNQDGSRTYVTGNVLSHPTYSFTIVDMMPGSSFTMDGETIYIGVTGSYSVRLDSPITSIVIPEGAKYTGSITYEYKSKLQTEFDFIKNIKTVDVPAHQFIGGSYWTEGSMNIIELLTNLKTSIVDTPSIRLHKRGVHKIYINRAEGTEITINRKFYQDGNSYEHELDLNDLETTSLYQIYWSPYGCDQKDIGGKIYYVYNGITFNPYTEYYYDPYSGKIIEDSYDMYDVIFNDLSQTINIEQREDYEIRDIFCSYLWIGDGVIAELTYIKQVLSYGLEDTNIAVMMKRQNYEKALASYWNIVMGTNIGDANGQRQIVKRALKDLCDALKQAIIELQQEGMTNG